MRDNIWRKHWRRYGILALGSAVTLAATALTGTAAASTRAGATPGTLLPGSLRLDSVYCTASSNCWAVGVRESKASALLNQIVHWNGKKWTAVAAPNPAGGKMGDSSELAAVRCTSASNCWAVGDYEGKTSFGPEALHWNGKKWGQTQAPKPGGTASDDFTNLTDVACTSASNCWAAGDYGTDSISDDVEFNLLLHWTGKKWFKVKTPNPGGNSNGNFNFLDTIRCASPKDCWAAGSDGIDSTISIGVNEMLHWNGTKWTLADVPNPGGSLNGAFSELSGLSCTSASNCWAVGSYGGDSSLTQESENDALQWNGHEWTQVKTPNPDGTANNDINALNSVTCSAADNCWAVGNLGSVNNGGAQTGEVLHWKGTKWTLTKVPNPGGTADGDSNSLNSVRCVSQKDCWIVGYSQINDKNDLNLILHWNSAKWTAS